MNNAVDELIIRSDFIDILSFGLVLIRHYRVMHVRIVHLEGCALYMIVSIALND